VIFDVDGTLCIISAGGFYSNEDLLTLLTGEPQNYMFAEMREVLGIPKSVDILEHVNSLPKDEQEPAMDKIKTIERRAMKDQRPQPGLTELMTYLDSRRVRKAICTRNFE
jgi:phosphoglycolate phosphatase-like HAD superfamily hydrolase